MDITIQTLILKEKIASAINEAGLPSINVLYVLEGFRQEVNNHITMEVSEYSSKKEEDSNGTNECNDTDAPGELREPGSDET